MKYKLLYCYFLSLLFSLNIKAQQNLVLNPSFEDIGVPITTCSGASLNGNTVNNWSTFFATFDLLHMHFPTTGCIWNPMAPLLDQLPHTGNAYAGGALINGTSQNLYILESILGSLATPLIAGSKYKVSFYVVLSESGQAGHNQFGFKFFDAVPSTPTYQDIQTIVPDIIYMGSPIVDKTNWTKIEMEFTPTQNGLQYFAFGAFNPYNTIQETFLSEQSFGSYYLFDDFSVVLMQPTFNQLGPFCQGTNFSLPTTSLDGVSGTWSPAINNQQTTTYTFTPNDTEFQPTQMTVEILPKQIAVFNNLNAVCYGDTAFQLPTISSNGISGTWDKNFNNTQSDNYIFTPNAMNCFETTEVTIQVFPEINFEVVSYCNENKMYAEVKHIGTTSDTYTYDWILNGNHLNENKPIVNLSALAGTLQNNNTLKVKVTDENLCEYEKTITNFEALLCTIPKGISPNGDGNNDFLNLVGLQVAQLKIYNRYGGIVYSKDNYVNEWHGHSNIGNTLPSGTYYYTIKTKYGEELVGWIQLVTESK